MKYESCQQFRERFPDLLIEPQTAPADLLVAWQQHLLQCNTCGEEFVKLQLEQQYGQQLVLELWQNLPIDTMRKTSQGSHWRKILVASLIATIMFTMMIGLYNYRHNQSDETLITQQLSRYPSIMTNASREQSRSFISEIKTHIRKVRKEFGLMREYTSDMQLTNVPFARIRLMLQCRLFLLDRPRCDELVLLDGDYSDNNVERLFKDSIINISTNPEEQLIVNRFFARTAPHLAEVIKSRSRLLNKLASSIQDFGGTESTLSVIRDIEKSLEF